jgi:hypothetical protein
MGSLVGERGLREWKRSGGEDTLQRISWPRISVGAAGMFLPLLALAGLYRWVLIPYIVDVTTDSFRRSEGSNLSWTFTSAAQWERYRALNVYARFLVLLLAGLVFLLGGLAVGRTVPSSPGPNGAASAALCATLAVVCLLAFTLPWILNPWASSGIHYEKLRFLSGYGLVFCTAFPFAVLSGYVGGNIGKRAFGTDTESA